MLTPLFYPNLEQRVETSDQKSQSSAPPSGSSGGGFAGRAVGATADNPQCPTIFFTTPGSSMVATTLIRP